MIDIALATIDLLSVHHVGNKNNGDAIVLSKNPIRISDSAFQDQLIYFFTTNISLEDQYKFKLERAGGKVFELAKDVFKGSTNFHLASVQLAQHLFDVSMHPMIKSGDVFVVYFKNIAFDGKNTHALGIFKAENKQSFLQVHREESEAQLYLLDGLNLDKLDKGALIFNHEESDGYRVCIVDKNNKNTDAEFWKNLFLDLESVNTDFHQTREYMSLAKTFVTTQYAEDFEVEKPEQIEMLQKSVEYFKTHENFNREEFEEEVLQYPEVIKSFQNFNHQFQEDNAIVLEDNFEISTPAVKKQQGIFKSIIKLDKNFHIYVHGNRELIERGTEPDGRKYYKIYFKEEE